VADADASATQVEEAWVNKTKAAYQQILQEGRTLTENQKNQLAQRQQDLQNHLDTTQSQYKTAYQGISTAVGGFFDDLVKQVVTGDMSFGKLFTKLWQDVADAVLNAFLQPVKIAITKFIATELANLITGTGDLSTAWKQLGQDIQGAISAIGKVGQVSPGAAPTTLPGGTGVPTTVPGEGAGGTGGAAGGAAGGLGGALGAIGAIGSAVTAISSVIGNFQTAKLETTMNAVEHNTRYTMMYVGERADGGILGQLFYMGDQIAFGNGVKAIEDLRNKFYDWTGVINPMIADIQANIVSGVAQTAGIVDILQAIRNATVEVVQGVREVNVSVQATGVTTMEAARMLGDQIAKNLATQLAPVTA